MKPIGRRSLSLALIAMPLALATCGARPPRYGEIASQLPSVRPDLARLYIYRDYEPYESLSRPFLYLNGARIGISEPGGVLYRDVPPGAYLISVDSYGVYPNQFKTVQMGSGQTYYAKITSLRSWTAGDDLMRDFGADTFVVVIVDPAQAQREIPAMWYFAGP